MSDSPTPSPLESSSIRYIAGLDGLRALAVAAVFLYHVDASILPGGFLGVEVFFVISGYLIASLLLREWHATGAINLAQFWLRRGRRLLPAVFVLVAGTLIFARLMLPDEVAGLRGDAASSLLYVANWYFVIIQKPYFEAIGRPSLFQHLWSLAVEEQFYILFPIVLVSLVRRFPMRRVTLFILAGAALSAALMAILYQPDADPSRVYYGTDTRAAGLLLGVALAMIWKPNCKHTTTVDVVGFVGLVGIGLAFYALNEYDPLLYYGGFTLVSLLTCAAIAAVTLPSSRLSELLGGRILRWAGTRSYSIYLWHYPILMVTRPQLDVPMDGPVLFVFRVVLALAAAEASYRWIETPIRNGAWRKLWESIRDAESNVRLVRLPWAGAIGLLALFSAVLGETAVNAQAPTPPALAAEVSLNSSWTDSLRPSYATPVPSTPVVAQVAPTVSATPTAPPTLIKTSSLPAPVPAEHTASVLAVGDSVMLGAAGDLQHALPDIEIDAAVGRQVSIAPDILRSHLSGGHYDTVIVHLGNNGPVSARQFDAVLKTLAPVKRVIVVNVAVPRAWQNTNNAIMAQGIKNYRNAVPVDWNAASASHGDYFWKDGVHLRPAGAQVYVALIAASVNAP